MPGICSTVCSYVCSPCVLVKNLLCGQPKKVKVDDATTADDFNDPRFDVEYGTGRGDGVFAKPYVDAFSDDEDDDDDDQHGNFQASLSARVDDSSASAADHLSPIPAAQPEAGFDIADPSVALLSMEQDLDSFLENMRNSNADLEGDMLSGDSSDSESHSDSRSISRSRSSSNASERPSQTQTLEAEAQYVKEDENDEEGSYHDEPDESANISNDLNAMYKDLSDSDEEAEDDGEASSVEEEHQESTSQVLIDIDNSAATN
eukprot:INCI3192.2.p2 GENE.INCI3192.2~~INCI3192.2.p2  ORF type:complete len:261 (-),score=69.38 INCI3192.2:1160-1942(-)